MKYFKLLDKPHERFLKLSDTESSLFYVDFKGEIKEEKGFNSSKYFLDSTEEYNQYQELSKESVEDTLTLHSKLIKTAIQLVKTRHEGQKDLGEEDYFKHLEYVASRGENLKEILVGYLHDILEDTIKTKDEYQNLVCLLELKFPKDVVKSVEILTKTDKNIEEYYTEIKKKQISKKSKTP